MSEWLSPPDDDDEYGGEYEEEEEVVEEEKEGDMKGGEVYAGFDTLSPVSTRYE